MLGLELVPGQLESNTFESKFFETSTLEIAGTPETVINVPNRLDAYSRAHQVYLHHGIDSTLYVGWGKQAPAQSQNERDAWSDIGATVAVRVGLRERSDSLPSAREVGFDGDNLGEITDMIPGNKFVKLLMEDGPLVRRYFDEFQDRLDPGAIVGLSHGFLIGAHDALRKQGQQLEFRDDITIVGMFPKGLGGKVREWRQLAATGLVGAGVNASIANYRDRTPDGTGFDIAAAWAVTGGGAPSVSKTTMENEVRSDLFGERAVLLGGIYGISVALYSYFYETSDPRLSDLERRMQAFRMSAETITGPLSDAISNAGLDGVAKMFDGEKKTEFNKAFGTAYGPMKELMSKIYRAVKSGREIQEVIEESAYLKNGELPKIGETDMWSNIGKEVAKERRSGTRVELINPTTAGIYLAAMKAQADLLLENGHAPSEIGNETILEAVNSLNVVMAENGIDALMDGCSVTAGLGAKKWGPQFGSLVSERIVPRLKVPGYNDDEGAAIEAFYDSDAPVHDIFSKTAALKPAGSLAVSAANR